MKVQIDDLIIEFANRMALSNCYSVKPIVGLPHPARESSNEIFTIACLAFPKYDRIIMLEKSNKLGGSSKLAVYSAFEFFDIETKESVFNRKKEIKKRCKNHKGRNGTIGYYYEPTSYDKLQELSIDFELNSNVELVEDGKKILINPHNLITNFLRKYKLKKLNENSKG